jgi:hypothetical protein
VDCWRAAEAGEGPLHRFLDGGRDQVVGDWRGDLLGNERLSVALGNVDAFAGGFAEEVLEELDEHLGVLAWGHVVPPSLAESARGRLGVLLRDSGA